MSKLFYKNMPSEEKIPAALTCHKHEQLLIVSPTSSSGRLKQHHEPQSTTRSIAYATSQLFSSKK